MVKRPILLAVILLLIGACVSTPVPTATLWAPTQTATFTPTVTNTPTPTSTPTSTVTPTATLTATPEFLSPTPVTLSTPPIIEVTPLGGEGYKAEGWQALPSGSYYSSINNLKIRTGPGTDYASSGTLYANQRVEVFAMHYWKYTGERWLCLDEPVGTVDKEFVCQRQVAYIVDSVQWGDLVLP